MLGHSFDDMLRLDDMNDVNMLKAALLMRRQGWGSHEDGYKRMTKLLKRLELFSSQDF